MAETVMQFLNHVSRNLRKIAPSCLVAGTFLLLFASSLPVFSSLFASWQTEEYSHGFFIPLISLLIGWHRLTEKKPTISSSWWGIGVFALGAMLIVIGRLSAFEPPSHYGFLLALYGMTLAVFGSGVVRALGPAFIYLMFAIPLPRLIYVGLSQDLQLWSSSIGVLLLRLFDIPVFQDGNIIDLGSIKLQVAEACSGLRYLFPLMSFGFLVALLLDDRWWKRAVVFLSTIPITIGINSLRIAIIGITVDIGGKGMAEGLLHDLEGWSMFLVCLLLLLAETWLLLRIGSKGQFRYTYFGFAKGAVAKGRATVSGPSLAALTLSVVLALVLGTGWIDHRSEIMPRHPAFSDFPRSFGQWKGIPSSFDRNILDALQVSDYLLEDYRNDTEVFPINFYMAYYANQRIGTSAHSPSNCLPGSGWQIVNKGKHVVALPDGQSLTVSRLLIRKGDEVQLVYYWFDERGRILTEQYTAKWYLLRDSIFMHRTDGALVRFVTPIGVTGTEAEADRRLEQFLAAIYPEIRKFIPGQEKSSADLQ